MVKKRVGLGLKISGGTKKSGGTKQSGGKKGEGKKNGGKKKVEVNGVLGRKGGGVAGVKELKNR